MADEKTAVKPQETPAGPPAENKDTKDNAEKGKKSLFLPLIIVAVIVLAAAGGGLGLNRLLGSGKSKPAEEAATEKDASAEKETAKPAEKSASKEGEKSKGEKSKSEAAVGKEGDVWYFNLDPVVANLDEPGATRYVRAAFTLEMPPEVSIDKGTAFLEQKKPLITNLLTIYLAGLNIESIRGDKNLKRIQTDLCDLFNERLYPDSKPMIKRILIKEFAVQ